MKILTVIINYRTADLTVRAICGALRAAGAIKGSSRVAVVDNSSGDDSVDRISAVVSEENWSDVVTMIASPFNGGFSYGNNLVLRPVLESREPPDYVYLLNPDAIPAEDALLHLVNDLEAHPRAGIAGSFIHGIDGRPHETAFRFPSILSEFESAVQLGILSRLLARYRVPMSIPQKACEVDWTAAVSMLIRMQTLREIGLFDERFFLYFEETDLCRRATNVGWGIRYVPQSKVSHVGSASTGIQDRQRRVPEYWFDSRSHYFSKNHGQLYLWLANAAQLLGGLALRARRLLQKRKNRRAMPERFLRDLLNHGIRGSRGLGRSLR
jgi:GT2 family glycosyltransferase